MWFRLDCMQGRCGELSTLKRARSLRVTCKCGTAF
ncbi:hypothetical protein DUNSADRAFT_14911 [Dunaliella salina]|uniref:Encoded protein n=1 Tax=Dunaliella salina TaxID=3046 RepID=A0ABQ7G6E7_DUNSA|nr:hypothetical protein DUNSADRAFT_14911 [Dunaliella salina]|eukprot:KAF5830181.1 hypothetical protein DUNSADRAFT_14911 [Dunaliella salina]